jgi:hypothetical protein
MQKGRRRGRTRVFGFSRAGKKRWCVANRFSSAFAFSKSGFAAEIPDERARP